MAERRCSREKGHKRDTIGTNAISSHQAQPGNCCAQWLAFLAETNMESSAEHTALKMAKQW